MFTKSSKFVTVWDNFNFSECSILSPFGFNQYLFKRSDIELHLLRTCDISRSGTPRPVSEIYVLFSNKDLPFMSWGQPRTTHKLVMFSTSLIIN